MAGELTIRGKTTSTSLSLPKNTSDEEWIELGEALGKFERSKMWWVGDWLKHKYPEGYVERGVYDELEEKTGIPVPTMRQSLWVCKAVDSSTRVDDLTFKHHELVAHIPEAKQQKNWLDKAIKDGLTVHQLREAIRGSKTPELPTDKYRVLYADPPWEYGNAQHGLEEQETVLETHYPTMSDGQLLAFPIWEIAADESVLFCWATSPRLPFAMQLISEWRFVYKAMFVWDKVKHNVGYYNSVRHELLLICTKGSCLPDVKELHDSVVTIERGEHSEKPAYFRELIDKMYPRGKRIELFARVPATDKWDVWGNEVE